MNAMEINKIAAAIFLAGLVAISVSIIGEGIYDIGSGNETHGEGEIKRGYKIEVAENNVVGEKKLKPNKPESITELLKNANIEKGKSLTKKCTSCHSFDKNGANKIGPKMWDIVGREKASISDFAYSKALRAKNGKWDYNELNGFLWKPKKWIKGTKMAFIGLKKSQDRADIIAYMRSLSDNPKKLP